ncbi:MAG: proline dehydrogenase family protein, partial [Deltaproteobacteria bacterium]
MNKAFEARVRRTGQKLFRLMGDEVPPLFRAESWPGRVIALCVRDESFKTDFVRFMDVLPCLNRGESVAEHLVEYFGRPEQRIPPGLRLRFTRMSAACLKRAESVSAELRKMMKRFIAAAEPSKALPILSGLRNRGVAFSVDLLGEAVVSEKEADAHAQRYLDLMDELGRSQKSWQSLGDSTGDLDWGFAAKINCSIKPTSLYSQISARAFDQSISKAKERLRPLLRKAIKIGAHLCFDVERYDLKSLSLALYRSLMEEPEFRGYPQWGTVLQAYLRQSEADLEELVAWAKKRRHRVSIRLVK